MTQLQSSTPLGEIIKMTAIPDEEIVRIVNEPILQACENNDKAYLAQASQANLLMKRLHEQYVIMEGIECLDLAAVHRWLEKQYPDYLVSPELHILYKGSVEESVLRLKASRIKRMLGHALDTPYQIIPIPSNTGRRQQAPVTYFQLRYGSLPLAQILKALRLQLNELLQAGAIAAAPAHDNADMESATSTSETDEGQDKQTAQAASPPAHTVTAGQAPETPSATETPVSTSPTDTESYTPHPLAKWTAQTQVQATGDIAEDQAAISPPPQTATIATPAPHTSVLESHKGALGNRLKEVHARVQEQSKADMEFTQERAPLWPERRLSPTHAETMEALANRLQLLERRLRYRGQSEGLERKALLEQEYRAALLQPDPMEIAAVACLMWDIGLNQPMKAAVKAMTPAPAPQQTESKPQRQHLIPGYAQKTLLTTEELAEKIGYDARTIRERLVDTTFLEGKHYVKFPGGRKLMFVWENIVDMLGLGESETHAD